MAKKKADKPKVSSGGVTKTVNYAPGVNLRAEPSLDAEVLRVLLNNEVVAQAEGVSAPDGWFAVSGGGFCMDKYLK